MSASRTGGIRSSTSYSSDEAYSVEIGEPLIAGPDRDLVGADGDDVVLAALGSDVLRDAVAQLVLGQDHELEVDVRILFLELAAQFLDVLHRGVGHGGDGDGAATFLAAATTTATARAAARRCNQPEGSNRGDRRNSLTWCSTLHRMGPPGSRG